MPDPIEKVSIIISKGSLEGVYPGLIMANGARARGSRRISSSHSSASTPSTRRETSTSSWRRWAILASTSQRWPADCQVSPQP